jgi:hypothetical protein
LDSALVSGKPEPVSTGVIVDFTARTVEVGHDAMPKFSIQISDITETIISFGGNSRMATYSYLLIGAIDRVTGTLEAIFGWADGSDNMSASYSLKCKPTQRMF